jgi:hypothetical protein
MKRRDLETHLRNHGCHALLEGANHAIWPIAIAAPRSRGIGRSQEGRPAQSAVSWVSRCPTIHADEDLPHPRGLRRASRFRRL